MRLSRSYPPLLSRLWRAVAALAAGLVILLSLSAVSPELHAWLHERSADHSHLACTHAHSESERAPASDSGEEENHHCAVTVFSHGVVHGVVAIVTRPCEGILRAENFRAFERLALAQPRYLHLPPQAPPAG